VFAVTPWAYDLTAEFYDEDMGRNSDDRDVSWYVSQAVRAAGARPVVELGAGTGRVSLALARAGLTVIAADRSPPMLNVLRRKVLDAGLEARILPLAFDMRRFAIEGDFGAILCPFSAFGYVTDPDERTQLLADVRRRLAPGGVFLLDMFIPDPALADRPDGEDIFDYRRPLPLGAWGEARTLVRSKRLTRNVLPSVNRVERRYRFLDQHDRLVREVETASLQRVYQAAELADVLRASGFNCVEVIGDFDPVVPPRAPAKTTALVARPSARP
jgi:SAM-dependent methyltransferase